MTLTRSKLKVKVTGLLNFRQLAKPCMLAAMTAAPLRGFLVTKCLYTGLALCASLCALYIGWLYTGLDGTLLQFRISLSL